MIGYGVISITTRKNINVSYIEDRVISSSNLQGRTIFSETKQGKGEVEGVFFITKVSYKLNPEGQIMTKRFMWTFFTTLKMLSEVNIKKNGQKTIGFCYMKKSQHIDGFCFKILCQKLCHCTSTLTKIP